jgi:thiamine-monophosphate kinase
MSAPHIPLASGREFDVVRRLLALWGPHARGVGDDAAVLDVPPGAQLVVSTDSSVEDVHFRRTWLTPEEIGWRATAAALSDLAAMGAAPLGLVWAATIPAAWTDATDELAVGVGAAARHAGCPIVGGDLTRGAKLAMTLTVLGTATRPLRRRGAMPGDVVWVTGTLGGPARALAAWEHGGRPTDKDRARFARPMPRIAHGMAAAQAGATAAVDVSDGLVQDAGHLAVASGVRLVLTLDALPLVFGADPLPAAASGEEYELVLTAPASVDLAAALPPGVPVTRIGHVEAGAGVTALCGGHVVEVVPGHDHFSGL